MHNTQDFGSQLNGVLVKQDGAANIGEMKVGVEGQLSKRFGLWATWYSRWAIRVTATRPRCWGVNTASDVTVHRMTGGLRPSFFRMRCTLWYGCHLPEKALTFERISPINRDPPHERV